jgi:multidrug efflux pump
MSLSTLSIRRPVLAIVLSIVIVLFGAYGFFTLGVREYPAVDPPIVTVTSTYAGANADVIESQITEPLEESINGIAGLRSLTSISREGRSQITVEFDLETDVEAAANDVRDRVSRAVRNLPQDADPPVVTKSDADANPVIMLTVASPTRDLLEVNTIANDMLKERLQNVPGVSQINIFGEKRYSMRIWLDPARLSAYGLTAIDVRGALQRENVELPSGKIEGSATELTVKTEGRLATPAEFEQTIVKTSGERVVRLRDVGRAALEPENRYNLLKFNGRPMVALAVLPQPGANAIEIVDEVHRRVDQIRPDLPKDIEINVGYDTTVGIRNSIDEVIETIAIAFGLVVLIIFVFLRNWRTTLIPALAIPVSLIGAFFVMYLMGFSINILTLLGIVLAIGLVVDDAIVVLENIYTKIEQGMSPMRAGQEGSKEIFFAVIATTIALVAVFLPVVFLQGLTGRLFREFGIVIAASVAISAFVALTLTPMLATRMIKHEAHGRFYMATERFFTRLSSGYRESLETFMRRRWLAPIMMLASFGLIWLLGSSLQSELAPMEDRSRLRIIATAAEGSTFDYMLDYMNGLTRSVSDSVLESAGVLAIIGGGGGSTSPNNGTLILVLKQPHDRVRSQSQIADALTPQLRSHSGARVIVTQEPTIGDRRSGLPVQFVLETSTFEKLREALPRFLEEANNDPTFTAVDANLKFNKPELRVEIDRDRARSLGVSVVDIAQTLQMSFSEQRLGYFVHGGKQYQVIAGFDRPSRNDPRDLLSTYVRARDGSLVQLDNLVRISDETAPPQLFRYNRFVSATVSAGLAPGRTIGDGIAAMQRIADRVLDESFTTALSGSARDYAESSSSLVFAFLFAIVLIYLVLAAQFESFRDPFIILLTVPLALLGALLSLWYFEQTLNIFSQIGIIMLIGLVTKNGILIVEFANQRKEQGLGIREAIVDAAASRFRPILMTSLATILGALPIALALGAGAESRRSMGIVVVGGLALSTLLTLYVIPAIYSYLSRAHARNVDEELAVPVAGAVVGEPALGATIGSTLAGATRSRR